MSTETLTQNLTAGVLAIFGSGTQFVVVTSSGPLNIRARQLGNSNKNRTFSGVPAGFKFTADNPDDGFDILEVTSPSSQQVTLSIGDDDVTFSNSVTVAGTVTTIETPAGTIIDNGSVVCSTAAQTNVVPQNLNRKRVTLSLDPTFAAGNVWVRKGAGTANLLPLQPGVAYEFAGTYAIDVRNDTGVAATVFIFEEAA